MATNQNIGALNAAGQTDIGAEDLSSTSSASEEHLRRMRELHIRRQVGQRIGARELWSGQRRTRRLY